MRSRRVILATASALLVLAVFAGALASYQLSDLRRRQDDARAYVQLARSVGLRVDRRAWTFSDPDDVRLFAETIAQLDALDPREPVRGSRERLRTVLAERRELELEPAARELHVSTLEEIDRILARAGERTTAVGQNILQISLVGGPLLALLAAGFLLATIYLPLRRAGQAPSAVAAAEAVSGVSSELAELLRDLDAERRARVMDLVRTGHLAALGTFAAGIAHEVRNPLMAISGVAEVVRRRLEAGDASVDLPAELERIDAEAHRAGELLGQVLRLAPGRPQEDHRFDLVAEARDVVSMVAARFRLEGASIGVEAPAHLVVWGHSARYRQILFNLLTNAVESVLAARRSLEENAVRLRLATAGDAVRMTVEDRGTGFDQSEARRLFEPFYSSKGRGGSGLGLFICEGLAREVGGVVEAFSRGPGDGAAFRVTIPGRAGGDDNEPRTDH